MAVFAYEYTYDASLSDKMDEIRPLHRGYLGEGAKTGKVLGSGPYMDTLGALILVRFDSAAEAAEFMDKDPFFVNGLVSKRVIHEWKDVLGAFVDF